MDEKIILKRLVSSYNISFCKIDFFRKGGSISYCVSDLNKKYFLKIIPIAFMDTAKISLDILNYLKEYNFPSPTVILTKNGLPYIEVDENDNKTIWVLFDYIEGNEPDEVEDIEAIGELVGRLHCLMRKYKGDLPVHNKEFFINRYIDILYKKNYDKVKIQLFREYGDNLWKKVENLPRGFSHGDLHKGNLLKTTPGNYYILDFDTSCNAFPIYDIMIMCNETNYFKFDDNGYLKSKRTYETFLNGYMKYCTLSDSEIKAFYDLIGIYHYQLQATIIEINGLDCVDNIFLDNQLDWLIRWREQCDRYNFICQ